MDPPSPQPPCSQPPAPQPPLRPSLPPFPRTTPLPPPPTLTLPPHHPAPPAPTLVCPGTSPRPQGPRIAGPVSGDLSPERLLSRRHCLQGPGQKDLRRNPPKDSRDPDLCKCKGATCPCSLCTRHPKPQGTLHCWTCITGFVTRKDTGAWPEGPVPEPAQGLRQPGVAGLV